MRGINTLDMVGCTQITNEAFEYLRGIQSLDMWGCTQIINKAVVHLRLARR